MIYSDFPISVADNVDNSFIEIKDLNDLIEAQKAKEIVYQGTENSMILFDAYNSTNHNINNWFYQYRSQLACVSIGHNIPLKTQAQYQAPLNAIDFNNVSINQAFLNNSTYKFRYTHSWFLGSECDPTALGVRYRVMRSATGNVIGQPPPTYTEDTAATQEVVSKSKSTNQYGVDYYYVTIEVTVTDNTLKYWKIEANVDSMNSEAFVINNPGVLISPRHVLYRVGNTDPAVGYQIRFVSANGTLVFGIVKSVKKTDNGNFIIACLDRDLDKLGISFAKIFDENLLQDFNNQQYISLVGVSGSSYEYEIKKRSYLGGQHWTKNNLRMIFPAFEKVRNYCFSIDPFLPWSFLPDTTDVVPWVAFYFYNNRLILRGIGIISPDDFSSLDDAGKISENTSTSNFTNLVDCETTVDAYTVALAAHMTQQVDSRLVGKDATTDQRLFTGLTRNVAVSPFAQNATCWLNDLRSQLCGFHMGSSNYGQGYGLMPLGGRFFLCVAHNGPSLGTTYWPLPDGSTFTATTQSFYVDRSINGGRNTSGNPGPTFSGPFDFCIYITDTAAPPTLSIIPIVKLNVNQNLLSALNPPTVYISQGGAAENLVGKQATPQNRKCAVSPINVGGYSASYPENTYPLRSSFGHVVSSGDSGCPQYLLINNKLYLYKMNAIGSPSIGDANAIIYLQDLVNRAAAAHGIQPVTITTVTNPPLS